MDKTIYRSQPCPHCGAFTNRAFGTDAIIVKNNQILLAKRRVDPFKGYWAIFGGHINWDEKPIESLKREIKEEANLEIKSAKLLDVYGDPQRHPKQTIIVVYVVEPVNMNAKAGDDIEEVKWVDLDAIPQNLAFDHNKIISDYLNRKDQF